MSAPPENLQATWRGAPSRDAGRVMRERPRMLPASRAARHATPSGFTLPEVLACLVLVGLVLPGVMKGVSLAMAASDDARKRVEATGLAETKLSEIAGSASTSQNLSTAGDFGDERPGFRWDATSGTVDTDLTEIRVRVFWTGRGVERSVDLSSFAYVGMSSGSITTTTPPAGPGGGGGGGQTSGGGAGGNR
jgi:prepilin-type N-terminal cleavage/methylation domain-containing protein